MINLLPVEDKILIRKEYLRRLLTVIGFCVFALIFIAVILLFPSYFLLVSQKKSLTDNLDTLQKRLEMEAADKIEFSVRDLNVKFAFLSDQENNFRSISGLIKQILDVKSSSVKLIGFSYRNDTKEGERFLLQGSSATRLDFLNFIKDLEAVKGLAKVISPASNLLKGENIIFNLTLELIPLEPSPKRQ